ncbi:MAG: hypothetical protein ACRCUT_07310, partial [Spirochaetota bacterium]
DTAGLPAGITFPDTAAWESSFQEMADVNGPAYANAFYFSNSLGYAVGKSTIGSFPHFEVGTTVNAGLTNMENFRHSSNGIYNGSVPGIGLAPCVHFGLGLGGGFDFIGKFMSFNQDIWAIPIPDNNYLNLKTLSVYALGGRVRYNYINEKALIPFLLKFGGVTFSAGGDLMRGLFGISGNYTYQMDTQAVDVNGVQYSVLPELDSSYTLDVAWYQLSTSAQATAYFDILYLFSLYTGFGVTVGYGWFNFDFNAEGTLSDVSDPSTFASANGGSSEIGTVTFISSNKYHPQVLLPVYIVGLEINIALLKIVAESQVNLRNRADVSASLGLRIQI